MKIVFRTKHGKLTIRPLRLLVQASIVALGAHIGHYAGWIAIAMLGSTIQLGRRA